MIMTWTDDMIWDMEGREKVARRVSDFWICVIGRQAGLMNEGSRINKITNPRDNHCICLRFLVYNTYTYL